MPRRRVSSLARDVAVATLRPLSTPGETPFEGLKVALLADRKTRCRSTRRNRNPLAKLLQQPAGYSAAPGSSVALAGGEIAESCCRRSRARQFETDIKALRGKAAERSPL